jgi:enoyl-CoA hydratase/carnithine racemase
VPVLTLDAGLLADDPAAAGSRALEAVRADVAGEAALLRFEGPWPGRLAASARELLATVAALTLAVGAGTGVDTRDFDAGVFDALAADGPEADRAVATFETAPHAAVAAALLVRVPPASTWSGLVAESTTYSMLQAGPEFQSWRARTAPAPAPTDGGDDGPRIRVRRAGSSPRGPVTEIVLTRPERRNALDVRMRDELHAALTDALTGALGAAGPIIVRGDGASFSQGGDLDEFGTFPDPVTAHEIRLARSLAWRFAQLRDRLIVGLHGAAVGSGIELPAFAGRVVAADHTRIALPELALGLIPGAGGTVSIPARIGRQRFLALLLRGGTIPASTAQEWGLVDEVVPRAELETRLLEIAESSVT